VQEASCRDVLRPEEDGSIAQAKAHVFEGLLLTGMIQHHNGARRLVKDVRHAGRGRTRSFNFAQGSRQAGGPRSGDVRLMLEKKTFRRRNENRVPVWPACIGGPRYFRFGVSRMQGPDASTRHKQGPKQKPADRVTNEQEPTEHGEEGESIAAGAGSQDSGGDEGSDANDPKRQL